MSTAFGFAAKVFRLTTGTRAAWPGTGAPSNLSEVSNVKDISIPIEAEVDDATTRAGAGWKASAPGLMDAPIDVEMLYDLADTHMVAFQTAFFARTTTPLAFLNADKATVGTYGLWADFAVVGFEKMEPVGQLQRVKVSFRPGVSSVPPAWIVVA